ncbi:hypothetical protein ACFE04_031848 [Oxalis oulophora]
MNYARHVFDTIPEPTVFAWNVMMKGYFRMNSPKAGVLMYVEMLMKGFKPDRYTFPLLLKGFTRHVALEFGTELHAHVLKLGFESNVFVQNALIHMYCLCGKIDMARQIFDMNTNRDDVVTWNVMISGYNRMKKYDEARKLFGEMEKKRVLPSLVTLVSVLSCCSKLKDIEIGIRIFDMNSNRDDVVTWNVMISGYNRMKKYDEARKLFGEMEKKRVLPSLVTLVSVLSCCSKLKDIETGIRVHNSFKKSGANPNLILENNLRGKYDNG